MRKQFYNIEDGNGEVHRILVSKSIQFDPYERYLTVSAKSKAWNLSLPCHAVAPTPYYPKVIFSLD